MENKKTNNTEEDCGCFDKATLVKRLEELNTEGKPSLFSNDNEEVQEEATEEADD